MKKLFLLMTMFISVGATACPDLRGTFSTIHYGDNGETLEVTYKIVQTVVNSFTTYKVEFSTSDEPAPYNFNIVADNIEYIFEYGHGDSGYFRLTKRTFCEVEAVKTSDIEEFIDNDGNVNHRSTNIDILKLDTESNLLNEMIFTRNGNDSIESVRYKRQ